MKLFEIAPNGYFAGNLMFLWQPGEPCVAAKGFALELPDWRHAPPALLNQLHEQLRLLLRSLEEGQRLQWQWFCNSDFQPEINRYAQQTGPTQNEWVRLARQERAERYLGQMRAGALRRQHLAVFLSRPAAIHTSLLSSRRTLLTRYEAAVQQLQEELERFGDTLKRQLGPFGVRVQPMTDADHYRHCAQFFNPSLAERADFDPLTTFAPELSLQENCWLTEAAGIADVGFWMDGYQTMLCLSRWPQMTRPGLIHKLTHLKLLHYRLTVSIEPLSVAAEILREEKAHRRLLGDLVSEKKLGLETVLEKKKIKIRGLMEGFLRCFLVRYLIRTWAPTREALVAQTLTLKQAINGMNGAQYFEAALPATAKKLFFLSWPGWSWGSDAHWKLYAQDDYLADLLPLSSSFVADLATAEALYDGPQQSLVGISTFSSPP